MTVAEMIEALKAFPQDIPVCVYDGDWKFWEFNDDDVMVITEEPPSGYCKGYMDVNEKECTGPFVKIG